MSQNVYYDFEIPSSFLGLRILLVDSDTASMLDITPHLEYYSYKVTTTELPTSALSILQERPDSFDLIMAEMNMPEMDCFEFMKNVQLIKDLPIILMSEEDADRSVVEEAIMKGACFFVEKPISIKNLANVWQHVYRETYCKNQGARVEEQVRVNEIVDISNEQVGDSDEAMSERGDQVDGVKLTESKQGGSKRALSSPEMGENKKIRTENETMKMDSEMELASSNSGESRANFKKGLKLMRSRSV